MSTAVLSDAQFGIGRVLRPFNNFVKGAASGIEITESFTVPSQSDNPNTFDVVVYSPNGLGWLHLDTNPEALFATPPPYGFPINADSCAMVSIGRVGTFALFAVSGTGPTYTLTLVNCNVTNPSYFSQNQVGTFDPTGEYTVTVTGGYDGLPSSVPIMFTDGGIALDELAGRAGYSPRLIKGLPVPMGSRIILWVPRITTFPSLFTAPVEPPEVPTYQWEFSFRIRNLNDYKATRQAYHLGTSSPGAPEILPGPTVVPRLPILASDQTVVFNGLEPPAYPWARMVTQRTLQEGFKTQALRDPLPVLPGSGVSFSGEGSGHYQQGVVSNEMVFPPNASYSTVFGNGAFAPMFDILEIQCPGDELMVRLVKLSPENWDFESNEADKMINFLFGFGFSSMGVVAFGGSAP